ncbi:hypothetical protein FQN51_008593 [Onygenales sp. PD_10]|nr:hypothetical protein FQN51_008593 [Onygenales sp. PD_10]
MSSKEEEHKLVKRFPKAAALRPTPDITAKELEPIGGAMHTLRRQRKKKAVEDCFEAGILPCTDVDGQQCDYNDDCSSGQACRCNDWFTCGGFNNGVKSKGATTSRDENVYIARLISELGSWSPDLVIQLTGGKPAWPTTTNLLVGVIFEYKYTRKSGTSAVVWESNPNRTYIVPNGCDGRDAVHNDMALICGD